MDSQLVKISLVAEELGVTMKTIYNWINLGKLETPNPGYVYRADAHAVWINQQSLRSINSFFLAINTSRDSNGKFSSNV